MSLPLSSTCDFYEVERENGSVKTEERETEDEECDFPSPVVLAKPGEFSF